LNAKTEIIYGFHPVWEALQVDRRTFYEIYIPAKKKISKRLEKVIVRAESLSIPVKTVNRPKFHSITGTELHQSIGAKVSPYPLMKLSDIVHKHGRFKTEQLILLLDSVLDPNNLGALVRTAVCAGLDGIIIPKDRSAPPSPAVSKSSSGALEHARLVQVTNVVNTIKSLKEKGLWVIGLDRHAKQSVYETDMTCAMVIVIGSEDKGIRPLAKKNCDILASIPQLGPVDSLNASAAGAIVIYEAIRQRNLPGDSAL
jgi:23S rRNA (guanosine2251-2'-O)-methyltransferase